MTDTSYTTRLLRTQGVTAAAGFRAAGIAAGIKKSGAPELALQVADHVQGNGVETGGAIEGQVTDVVADLGQHFVLRGIHERSLFR